MNINATKLKFGKKTMWVDLSNGRRLRVPLNCFPRLGKATPAQREAYQISPGGLHWDSLDEDISIQGLLAGRGDLTRRFP